MGKFGFIGLGSQGAPMAQRMIDAGLDVVLWARRPETLQPFAGTTATYADSIASLAKQVTYCAICVVDDLGVQQVCEQLIPAMPGGGYLVVHSTVHPQLCQKLSRQAHGYGLSLIDAPVSGGGQGAADGTLTVMVGGSEDAIKNVRPVFNTFASHIAHLGDVGSGQRAKLVNNNLMAANLALAHHALALAETLGIQREEFIKLVSVSSGRSLAFEVCSRINDPTDFRHGAALLKKDLGLLADSVHNSDHFQAIRDVATPFLESALAE
ncbi:NAD(P)-dependent oxidoreductase [Ketobacter sp. MCCC 1A13808]|uniref:NAD(P)-dependent oxidoreductase n=1 Tax=Ketobacter sp. MCCC 1A13808 TaxID=2602738 RepID=UPI000F2376BF|nr:NAD(P)-dependent oxidoreductase [Ketobacter sp. MCCC 1A13808]MVF11477.1 NAD(P)-dependent oxidoreductase [Ketobacter sp. MCCC 1A13808]RLP54573.1 MAG: NAD(P)-dependent oxidoreductase [Ketobacter sp.]